MYQPNFICTNSIVRNLMAIEYYRAVVERHPLPSDVEKELYLTAKLKATRYSTGIEGNRLDMESVRRVVQKPRERQGTDAEQEVRNYWNALTFLSRAKNMKIPVTESFIQRLHAIIEVRRAGRRQKYSAYRGPTPAGVLFAVRDSITGAIDYIPPEATDVPCIVEEFVEWLNSESVKDLPVPIRAAISAYQLLTIHPFPDGNGRTARALATYILSIGGYDLKGFYSLEEFYWHDLTRYYSNLQMGLPPLYYEGRVKPPDLAPWIDYFTETMALAFELVAEKACAHYNANRHPVVSSLNPNEREVLRLLLVKNRPVTPVEMAATLNGVPLRTVRRWCEGWVKSEILEPASGIERVRSYQLGARFKELTLKDLGYEETL